MMIRSLSMKQIKWTAQAKETRCVFVTEWRVGTLNTVLFTGFASKCACSCVWRFARKWIQIGELLYIFYVCDTITRPHQLYQIITIDYTFGYQFNTSTFRLCNCNDLCFSYSKRAKQNLSSDMIKLVFLYFLIKQNNNFLWPFLIHYLIVYIW